MAMKTQIPVTRRRRSRQRGNVLVEFALMSTVLLMMTLGVVDFGRIFSYANRAADAASAGTAYGALSPAHYTDIAGIQAAAQLDLGSYPNTTVAVTQTCRCSIGGTAVSCPATCTSPQYPMTYIKVDVTIPFNSLSKLIQIPGLTNVKATSVVRVE